MNPRVKIYHDVDVIDLDSVRSCPTVMSNPLGSNLDLDSLISLGLYEEGS